MAKSKKYENKKLTILDCYREMERILRLFLYYKNDKADEERYKEELKIIFQRKGQIEADNIYLSEKRRADREARKYGIDR